MQKLGNKCSSAPARSLYVPKPHASDSCFNFADLTVLLPVSCLHCKDEGCSSLMSSPTWLHVPASSLPNTPRLAARALFWEQDPQLRKASEVHFSVPAYGVKPTASLSSYFSNMRKPEPCSHVPPPRGLQHPGLAPAAAPHAPSTQALRGGGVETPPGSCFLLVLCWLQQLPRAAPPKELLSLHQPHRPRLGLCFSLAATDHIGCSSVRDEDLSHSVQQPAQCSNGVGL